LLINDIYFHKAVTYLFCLGKLAICEQYSQYGITNGLSDQI